MTVTLANIVLITIWFLVLIRKLRNDQKVSCQAVKADEILRKSSEFGRGRTIEYLQALALEQEETLIEYHSKIEKLRNLIIDLRRFMEGVVDCRINKIRLLINWNLRRNSMFLTTIWLNTFNGSIRFMSMFLNKFIALTMK